MALASRLSFKIPAIVFAAALIAGVGNGITGLVMVNQEMEHAAEIELETVVQSRASELRSYLTGIEEDLTSLAASPMAFKAVKEFQQSWDWMPGGAPTEILQTAYIAENPFPTGQKEELDRAEGGLLYHQLHGHYHPAYRTFLRAKGYYDIFLFNLSGDLLYTVFKEQDFATNLVSGPYAGSGLGQAYQAAAAAPEAVHFFDFAPYEPSYGAPASFISTGVADEAGAVVGVLVFQMPIDRINAVMQSPVGLLETGDTVIVGSDGLRRSDSRFASESAILEERIEIDGVARALAGETGFLHASVAGVDKVIGYAPFEFHDARWAILAMIDEAEAYATGTVLVRNMLTISAVILAAALLLGTLFSRTITRPMGAIIGVMGQVADGAYGVDVPYRARKDEVGDIARALETFRENGAEADRLRAEQEKQRERAQAERVESLRSMADNVETEAGQAVDRVAQQTRSMEVEAESMAGSAEQVEVTSQTVAAAAQQALANAEAVSAATEELAASIQEIGDRVGEGARITQEAVTVGRESQAEIESLLAEAEKIGEIATLIGDIAEQTNLLALNATIEAARAGDAGKGFAVVASEVKNLAGQTGKATGDIAAQIQEIQERTRASVDAVQRMVQRIADVDGISTAIAAAMEEQQAATQEIARNVTETASAARDVAENIDRVSNEAQASKARAGQVRTVAESVHDAVEALKKAVIRSVRTASDEVDRRTSERRAGGSEGTLSVGGLALPMRLVDVSEGGARVIVLDDDAPTLVLGARVTIGSRETGSRAAVIRSVDGQQIGLAFS